MQETRAHVYGLKHLLEWDQFVDHHCSCWIGSDFIKTPFLGAEGRGWPRGWGICSGCGKTPSNPCSALFGANSTFPVSHGVNPHQQGMCWPLGCCLCWDPFPISFCPSVSSWARRFFPESVLCKWCVFCKTFQFWEISIFFPPASQKNGKTQTPVVGKCLTPALSSDEVNWLLASFQHLCLFISKQFESCSSGRKLQKSQGCI